MNSWFFIEGGWAAGQRRFVLEKFIFRQNNVVVADQSVIVCHLAEIRLRQTLFSNSFTTWEERRNMAILPDVQPAPGQVAPEALLAPPPLPQRPEEPAGRTVSKWWKALSPRRKIAGGLGIIGVSMLVVAMAGTGTSVWFASNKVCSYDAAEPPAPNATVHTAQGQIYINGQVCVGVKIAEFFKPEIDVRNAKKIEFDNAQTAVAEKANPKDAGHPAPPGGIPPSPPDASIAKLQSELAAIPTLKRLPLFIDGIVTAAVLPVDFVSSQSDEKGWIWGNIPLYSPVDGASDAAQNWRQILTGASQGGERSVKIGLGDGVAVDHVRAVAARPVLLHIYNPWLLMAGILGLVLVAAAIVVAGWKNGLLRDRAPGVDDPNPTFSLSRVQMAWWLLISVGGYLYIWLVTGAYLGVITPTVFTLIGISGTSGLAVAAMKQRDIGTNQSVDFMTDILSDGTSIVLHRVQMLAWTFILGAVFLWTTLWSFTFPTFDTNLMVLAGIVNGFYLGFRAGE